MKIVIFTSNSLRHKFVANSLVKMADEAIIFSECKESYLPAEDKKMPQSIREHFALRQQTENNFWGSNECFNAPTVPLVHRDTNSEFVHSLIKKFQPDVGFVFGSCILKDTLLSLIPTGRFINLHLGLSPYYRGSGTNFWPFVNNELEYVGATLLHIDVGVDTGDIVAHVRPKITPEDNVHTIGCKTIENAVTVLMQLADKIKNKEILNRVKQWQAEGTRYYRSKDFNERALWQYHNNMKGGLINNFLNSSLKEIRLIES